MFIHCGDRCERVWFRVCLKECKKDVCEVIGRTSERARFRERHLDTPGARTTFFDQHRLGFDSRGDLIDSVEYDDVTAEMMLVLVDNFLVVPLEVVEASGWMDVASGRWRYRKENIKLASLFFALDLAVTVRWVLSETIVSDQPSRIHDPSDIRDKTMTDLLATVLQERTHRDEMMAQRDPTKTSSMIQDGGTPCATSLEAGCKHYVRETETVTTRKSPRKKRNEPFTDIALGKATDVKSENTCRRRECREWEREGERCNVDHRGGCGDRG